MSTIFLASTEDVAQVLRQSARKQLDSYADMWIALFEALQNALDAVEDSIAEKRVRVTIDPNRNEVTVSDNGSGFPVDPSLFGLGKGTKGDLNNKNIRGEHGVGLKMVILCSSKFELWTQTRTGGVWKAQFDDGWKFLEAKERESFTENANDSEIPDGFRTTVKYQFPREGANRVREIELREILNSLTGRYRDIAIHPALKKREQTALFIEHFFRTSCYTGDVNRLFDDIKPAKVEVNIIPDTSLLPEELRETYPDFLLKFWARPKTIEFPAKYWDPLEWYDDPERKGFRLKSQLTAFNPAIKTPKQIWVLKLVDRDDFRHLLVNPHMKDGYPRGYFDHLIENKIRGIYAVVGPASRGAKYNINEVMLGHVTQVIAADGVVTTNQLRAPKRGRNQNYLINIHFVVNIADRVNYGKQGVKNPLLLSLLYDYFEEIYVKKLVDLATSVAGKSPPPSPGGPPTVDVVSLADLGVADLSIAKEPRLENTLIALTHELIGKGRLKGIKTFQLSSLEQYDGLGLLEFRDAQPLVPTRDTDLHVVEYKVSLMELVNECELGDKDLADIDLAIVWDATLESSVQKYQLLDIEASSYDKLTVTGVSSVLRNIATGEECAVLEVKTLLTS